MPYERTTIGLAVAAWVLCAFGAAAPAARADEAGCNAKTAPEQRISSCGDLIRSGDLSASALADAHIMRGNAYAETSDHARALADYDQAIRLGELRLERNGNDDEARRALAKAYFERGSFHVWRKADFERGIADLDTAIGLDSNLTAAYSARGWAYQASGDFDRANVDYEEAIRRNVDACPLSMPALHPA